MNFSKSRYSAEWAQRWYPAFSRRATQVCILSSALEKIALGAPYAREIAYAALAEADAFSWNKRVAGDSGSLGEQGMKGEHA